MLIAVPRCSRIYEDNVNGKPSDKRFEMLLTDYETEQSELELSVDALEKTLNDFQENADNVDKYIELVHRYTDFTELTTPMIHEFIDKIVVHEADKSTRGRIQQIDIYLKFLFNDDIWMRIEVILVIEINGANDSESIR